MKECLKCGTELVDEVPTNEDGTICMNCVSVDIETSSSNEMMPYVSIIISGVAFFMTWYFSGRGLVVEFFGAETYFAADWVVDMVMPMVMFIAAIGFAFFTVPKERKKLRVISLLFAALSLAASFIFLLLQ